MLHPDKFAAVTWRSKFRDEHCAQHHVEATPASFHSCKSDAELVFAAKKEIEYCLYFVVQGFYFAGYP